jgi:hypothetical protein
MKKTALSLSFAALGLLGPAAAQEKQLSCDDHVWGGNRSGFCEMREQTVPATGRMTIDGKQNGGVSVKGWDRTEVLVRSQVRAQSDNDADSKATVSQVIVHALGGTVSADGPSGKSWSVSYEVFVPRQSDLTLTAHNGGIHIEGIRGNIDFSTINGGVHLAQLAGQVKGSTQNGGVHMELSGNRWDGQGVDVRTQNGGVHVNVPATYSAHFETSTVNGSLHSDFNELVRDRKQRDISADIGGGGPPVKISTTNGGVHIGKT